ncbi:hypothetical protein L1080_003960 [Rhodococcus sp. MSC1_016]|jgi:hypothetical protein|uniref:hypothetical protein n=1 Tax=Rhodococcus sp. MSC1_016 TaxID=2909266 RepID=UPI0020301983|nr:hypothetical protein [Rhodococcus sp. MSC1_016]
MTDVAGPDDEWDDVDPEEPIIEGDGPKTIEDMARDSQAGQDPNAPLQNIGGSAIRGERENVSIQDNE